MIAFQSPGDLFFEPSDKVECVECHEITHESFTSESVFGEIVCYDCMTDWGE